MFRGGACSFYAPTSQAASNGSSRKHEPGPNRKAGPHNQRPYATRRLTPSASTAAPTSPTPAATSTTTTTPSPSTASDQPPSTRTQRNYAGTVPHGEGRHEPDGRHLHAAGPGPN